MYVPIVAALMFVVPAIFVVVQLLLTQHGMLSAVTIIPIIAKWYVFWAVGVRLGLAGLRQMIQPRYTAETILGIKGEDSLLLVRELGFANTAIGSVGLGSLFAPSWLLPAALAGAIFYGLAGINHALHRPRNKLQNVAMVSNLFAGLVLAACCVTA
ncbi:MAG: DUF6790 family protein [Steroidobacteraceae bacterium]